MFNYIEPGCCIICLLPYFYLFMQLLVYFLLRVAVTRILVWQGTLWECSVMFIMHNNNNNFFQSSIFLKYVALFLYYAGQLRTFGSIISRVLPRMRLSHLASVPSYLFRVFLEICFNFNLQFPKQDRNQFGWRAV